jgi:hypothetical protein
VAAFTPVLYGSKLNAPKKKAAAPPIALRGVPPGKTAPPVKYNLSNMLIQRSELQRLVDAEMSQSDRRPGLSVNVRKLKSLDEQIVAASAPAVRPAAPRPQPVAAVVAPVAPATAPAPVPVVAPVATPSPPEVQATTLKLADEEAARAVEKAKTDELARQDEIRRRRGYGISSFVTGGLRGLPTSLAQLLGT